MFCLLLADSIWRNCSDSAFESAVVRIRTRYAFGIFNLASIPCQYFASTRALTTREHIGGAIWAIKPGTYTNWLAFLRSSFRMMPDLGKNKRSYQFNPNLLESSPHRGFGFWDFSFARLQVPFFVLCSMGCLTSDSFLGNSVQSLLQPAHWIETTSGTFSLCLRRNECLFFFSFLLTCSLGNRTSVSSFDIGSSPSLTPGRQRLSSTCV